jgi:hypothetical protein
VPLNRVENHSFVLPNVSKGKRKAGEMNNESNGEQAH